MYVLHLDVLEADVRTARQVAATLVSAGATGVDVPSLEQARAEFDGALVEEPKVISRDRLQLLQALGLR